MYPRIPRLRSGPLRFSHVRANQCRADFFPLSPAPRRLSTKLLKYFRTTSTSGSPRLVALKLESVSEAVAEVAEDVAKAKEVDIEKCLH